MKWTEQEMIAHLKRQGITVTPPAQRKTTVLTESHDSDLQEEPGYQSNAFKGTLAPRNWKALSNPKVPWPQDCPPELALKEMCSLLAYKIMGDQAAAMGRSPEELYSLKPYDEV